jgi:hypothetical protein
MIKIQIIKLIGETAGMAITRTGGEGTLEEMVKVNEQGMFHYIDKLKEQEEINKKLQAEIEKLKLRNEKLEDDSLMLSCYRNAGIDNWDGASYAEEMFEEIKGEQN